MMKKTSIAVAVAAALGLSGGAFAMGPGHAYITGELGYGKADIKIDRKYKAILKEDKEGGLAGRIAGGYLFTINPMWDVGAELGYLRLTDNEFKPGSVGGTGKIKLRTQAIDLLGVAQLNFNPQFYLLGKAGGSYVMQKPSGTITIDGEQSRTSGETKDFRPKIALGAGYNITPNLAFTLTTSYTFGEEKLKFKGNKGEVKDTSPIFDVLAGVKYSF